MGIAQPSKLLASMTHATPGAEAPDLTAAPHEGDERPPHHPPDILTEVLDLPHALYGATRELANIRKFLAEAAPRAWWANTADASDLAATQLGASATCYAIVFQPQGVGAKLRNCLVGTSTAGTVRLVALKGAQLVSGQYMRTLGTVRTTATALSVPFPGELVLQPGECLALVYLSGAAVNLDFSGDYALLRGE